MESPELDLVFLLTVAWPLVSSASSNTRGNAGGGGGSDGDSFASSRFSGAGMVVDPVIAPEINKGT